MGALESADVLLIVLAHVDPATLSALRFVSHRINSIIVAHQKSVCNIIALKEHAINLDWHAPNTDHISKIPYIRALLRIPTANMLAERAINKGNFELLLPFGDYTDDAFHIRCTRGILIYWALIDIQRSVSPSQPIPKYLPVPYPKPAKRRGKIAQIFGFHKSRPSTSSGVIWPPIYSPDNFPIRLIPDSAYTSRQSRPSFSAVQERFSAIQAAREPFIAGLDWNSKVDLELALSQLRWLNPFEVTGCFGGPSLEYTRKCSWKVEWMFRQGPKFLLAVSSKFIMERAWAMQIMEAEWEVRCVGAETLELRSFRLTLNVADDPDGAGRSVFEEARAVERAARNTYAENRKTVR